MESLEDLITEEYSKKEKRLFGLSVGSYTFTCGSIAFGFFGYDTCFTTMLGGLLTSTSFLWYYRTYTQNIKYA